MELPGDMGKGIRTNECAADCIEQEQKNKEKARGLMLRFYVPVGN